MPANRLIDATLEDDCAKLAALELRMTVTMPLSREGRAHMCSLGEGMRRTVLRKSDAERDVCDRTIGLQVALHAGMLKKSC